MIVLVVIGLLFAAELACRSVLSTVNETPVPYYTVAIFEHSFLGNKKVDAPKDIKRRNLDMLEKAAEMAKSKGADIITFPEYGITPLVSREGMKDYLETIPDPQKVTVNPCLQHDSYSNDSMMYRLSCMARNYQLVVVANTGDIQPCNVEEDPNCPQDGTYHYNANVAFDSDGTIIGRYYKEQLIFEVSMDLPKEPQNPVFTTNFGKFAMFVCFDMVFKHVVDAAAMPDVDNVILTALWINRMPLMTSMQYFQGWAMGNNVTLIGSNGQIPGYSSVGSGVFGSKGVMNYMFNPDGKSKLLISRAPRFKHHKLPSDQQGSSITIITENGSLPYEENSDGKAVPDLCSRNILGPASDKKKDYRCFQENTVNYTFVPLTKIEDKLDACNNGMCCSLNYSAQSMNETYYLGVYNGTFNMFNRYFWWQENCLVVRCEAVNGSVCGNFLLRSETIFNRFELRANFTTNYVYPSVVESSMRLAPVSEWQYGRDGEKRYLTYQSTTAKPLVVAGLNGRSYERDPPYIR